MKHKKLWQGCFASLGMLVLILDSKTAIEGAQTGIELCLKTVIPSLFPFFILSILLTNSFAGASLPLLQPLGRLCGIPKGAESILISGFLGGYPVGAQCISASYRTGQISRKAAARMLAFCNNAGPAFLFGMVSSAFPSKWLTWVLWSIHIISAIFVSLVIPGDQSRTMDISENSEITLSYALRSAIQVMATVCGWVVVFRVLITFLGRWILWLLPVEMQVLLTGILELSNGCCELFSIPEIKIRFIICSGMLAFGGLCVTMQTISVANGLPLHGYFQGKLMQTVFSLLLSWGIMYRALFLCFVFLMLSLFLLRKIQKKSSIPTVIGV